MNQLTEKYRPKKFSEMIGNEGTVQVLRNTIKLNRVVRGYMLSGPYGCGKTTLARLFSVALNCLDSQEGEPCLKCPNCISIGGGTNPDVIEIDAGSSGKVDDIRDLLDRLNFAPVGTIKYRIVIVDECHQLTKQAASAMLKTLEDTESSLFIFATTNPEKVIDTIISRTMPFKIGLPVASILRERLAEICEIEKIPYDESGLRLLVRASGKHIRDALSGLQQVSMIGGVFPENIEKVFASAAQRSRFFEIILDILVGNSYINKLDDLNSEGMSWMEILSELMKCLIESNMAVLGADYVEPETSILLNEHSGREFYGEAMGLIADFPSPNTDLMSQAAVYYFLNQIGNLNRKSILVEAKDERKQSGGFSLADIAARNT